MPWKNLIVIIHNDETDNELNKRQDDSLPGDSESETDYTTDDQTDISDQEEMNSNKTKPNRSDRSRKKKGKKHRCCTSQQISEKLEHLI